MSARASTWRRTRREKALEACQAAPVGDALVPAIGRQDAGGDQCLDQRRAGFVVRLDEVADAALQAAGARTAGLGAEEPAPQLASFLAGEPQRERGIGGFEQMMPLVEDIARRHDGIVEPAQCGLGHDQRVVGDDDAGVARRAHVLFDKAAAKMRAGGMDAFAAPVGQRVEPAAADQLGEPARKIAGDEVARLRWRRSSARSARAAPPIARPRAVAARIASS